MKQLWARYRGRLILALGVFLFGLYLSWSALFPPPVEFMTVPVTRQDIAETVLATGTLDGRKKVSVGAQASGQLNKLHVALGESVKKGQLLAEIDPELQQDDLRDAEAALKNVTAQLTAKRALLKKHQLALTRQRAMRREDASAQADLESAEADLAQTRAEIESLEAQIAQARIKVNTARTNLGYTRILAPMDGVVIAIVTEEGQTVNAAQSAPTILKLADLDTMTVKAQISEADVIRVQAGQKSRFTILGEPDKSFEGVLRAIEPAPESESSDSSSSTTGSSSSNSSSSAIYYNGLFDVPNPGHKLRVSMTAEVTILLGESKQALTIPRSVLGKKQGDNHYEVMVLVGDHPEPRQIRTGRQDSANIEVLDGLKEGELIVLGDSLSAEAAGEAEAASSSSRRRGPPPGGH